MLQTTLLKININKIDEIHQENQTSQF